MKQNNPTLNHKYDKALIYCRVSSGKQVVEGNGLESQEQRCLKHASDKGYVVEHIFRDEGISGGLFDRPAMQDLIAFIDAHPEERYVVIFDDLKRFARDVRVHLQLKTTFASRSARLECPNFNFEDSPEGEFVEIIMAAAAQLERSQNRRQVIQKQRARLEGGYWSFHAPPGLKFKRDAGKGKILVPNEPLASIYKSAYTKFAEYNLNTLEQVRQFILDQYRFYKIDRKLSLHGVTRILTCPLYAGLIEYKPWGIPLGRGKHDGFIPTDLFYAVKARLINSAKPRLRKDYKDDFPLRNYLNCVDCRKPMTGSWHKGRSGIRYAHYWCKNHSCVSKNRVVSRDAVEREFVDMLEKSKPDQEILRLAGAVLNDVWESRARDFENKKSGLVNEVASIDSKTKFLLERITDMSLAPAVIRQYEYEIAKLSNKKTAIEAEIARERYSRKEFGKASGLVIEKLHDPLSLWRSPNLCERRLLLGMYFEKGVFYDRTRGLVKPELPILVRISQRRRGGSNKNSMVEMAGVKPASKTNFSKPCSQD